MNAFYTTPDTTEVEFDSAVAHHLHISTHSNPQPKHQTTSNELSRMLHAVLVRYVALLESDAHGGWSFEEERTVRAGVQLLSQTEHQMPLPSGRSF